MKQFTSAAKRDSAIDGADDIEFEVNGEVLVAHPPTSGQLTLFMSHQIGENTNPGIIAAALFDLLRWVLDEEDYAWLVAQVANGDLEVDLIMEIIGWLGEEWSGRPTSSASDSSPSRAATGKQSTAKPRKKAATRST